MRSSNGSSMSLGARSHIGKQRVTNEDAFCVLHGPTAPTGALACLAVADGMGGHRAGEIASSMAIKELTRLLGQRRFGRPPSPAPTGGPLLDDVQMVNREVHRASLAPDLLGMGTTLTAGVIVDNILHVAHVGDSRAYLLRDGRLQRLTRDHSWAEEQVAAGLMTPEQAAGHPGRNVLTRALGVAPSVEIDTAQIALEERDVVLLCSDGLHSQVGEEDIARILSKAEPQDACELLVEQANRHGGRDNITAVVLRVDHFSKSSDAGTAASDGHRVQSTNGGGLAAVWSKIGKAMGLGGR